MDHFFIIGVSEKERMMRCVLCKGSRYPPTTPRPTVAEIPMILPLCEPDTEKTAKETQLWQIGSHPLDENEAVLSLIAVITLFTGYNLAGECNKSTCARKRCKLLSRRVTSQQKSKLEIL